MKKIITGIAVLLLVVLAFTACQKDNSTPAAVNTKTQLTPEQINMRSNLRQTAIILAKIVNNTNFNREIYKQVKLKRRGLYRVAFSKLLKENNTLKAEPDNDFKTAFIKTAKEVLNHSNLKEGGDSDNVMTVNELISYLERNNINVYWPYSQNWNGTEVPTVTYQPFDNFDENEGFIQSEKSQFKSSDFDGIKTVNVNDDYAWEHPTLIVDTGSLVNYKIDTSNLTSSFSASVNDGNYDVNKIFIYKVRTNGKNFRGLFGGENVITFYQGGEELINSTSPLETTFQIDRWAGRKGVWRNINLVWDANWKPGEIQHWMGIKLHRVERVVKTTFGGDISLKTNASGEVSTKESDIKLTSGYTIKLFSWKVEISYKDYMGKNNIWERKQFFYENWKNADGNGTLDGYCIRAAGSANDPRARGGIFFTMRVNSYNYNNTNELLLLSRRNKFIIN